MQRVENQAGGQEFRETLSYDSIEECERFCQQTESCLAVVFYTFNQCVWFDDLTSNGFVAETETQATASFKECQDCKFSFQSVSMHDYELQLPSTWDFYENDVFYLSQLTRLWFFSSSVKSFFKRASAAIQWG